MAKIIERAKIDYEVVVVLGSTEALALSKILEWGAEVAADALLKAVSESEKPKREVVVQMMAALRSELPRVTRLGAKAHAVFMGRAIAHDPAPEGKSWRLVDDGADQ